MIGSGKEEKLAEDFNLVSATAKLLADLHLKETQIIKKQTNLKAQLYSCLIAECCSVIKACLGI